MVYVLQLNRVQTVVVLPSPITKAMERPTSAAKSTHVGQVAAEHAGLVHASSPIRVLLVDDHDVVLRGLESLLESHSPNIQVVGTAKTSNEACAIARELKPDLVLLDLDLAGHNGLEVLPTLVESLKTRVLIYTGIGDPAAHREAVLLGARGVVHKSTDSQLVVKAIRCVMAGEVWLDRMTTAQLVTTLLRGIQSRATQVEDPRIAKLTRREREIVMSMCVHAARPAKRVASVLNISEHTLRNHLSAIYEKLGVKSRADLSAFAERNGLAKLPSEPS